MSTLLGDSAELHKQGFAQRFFLRVVNWIKEEYRLTTYAHIRWKAEKGDAMAQYLLGKMCESGDAVFQTTAEALKWYQKAAFQGVAPAQLALGLKYLNGEGVSKSEAEALLWLRKAAEQGQAEAQYQLGSLYQEGRGATRDLLQAGKWFRKAADGGHPAAKKNFKDLNLATLGSEAAEEPPVPHQKLAA